MILSSSIIRDENLFRILCWGLYLKIGVPLRWDQPFSILLVFDKNVVLSRHINPTFLKNLFKKSSHGNEIDPPTPISGGYGMFSVYLRDT